EREGNASGNSNHEQVIDWEIDAEHLHTALQEIRQSQQPNAVAPCHDHDIADHVGNAVSQQHDIQHVLAEQRAGGFFNKVTNGCHDQWHDNKCRDKTEFFGDGISQVGSQNIESSLPEVDHVHAAYDQRNASHHKVGDH